jgi:hypothetical protein
MTPYYMTPMLWHSENGNDKNIIGSQMLRGRKRRFNRWSTNGNFKGSEIIPWHCNDRYIIFWHVHFGLQQLNKGIHIKDYPETSYSAKIKDILK